MRQVSWNLETNVVWVSFEILFVLFFGRKGVVVVVGIHGSFSILEALKIHCGNKLQGITSIV